MRVLVESYRLAAGLLLGACVGWSAEFISYWLLPIAVAAGYGAGEIMAGLWKSKSRVFVALAVPFLMAAGALLGRVAIAQLLLLDAPELTPPHGPWQAVLGLMDPSPAPLISLLVCIAAAEFRLTRSTRNSQPVT